jgi:FKBP-type peptidyl-prolyl cis-trans isomerase FklB
MFFRATAALLTTLGFLALGATHGYSQEQVGGAALAPVVPAGNTLKDPSSYALGFNVGSNFAKGKMSEKELDGKDFLLGFLDALSKRESKLTPQQVDAAFQALEQRMQKKMLEIAKQNMDKATAYLEANKKKDGVQTTKSGLQIQVIKTGNGKQPTLTDSVVAHYEGKLIEGTVFDSSIKRNKPETFPVSMVVPGWTEAIQRMKVGDKWVITLPPSLGYGEGGAPPDIGPNEALIFEIELLEVVKK